MIPIENKTDWNAIRAEYIGGGISQRKLAKKYGVAEGTLLNRANKEGWQSLRNQATIKTITEAKQKTAEAAADNATLAADIKKRLLQRISRLEQKFPMDATEIQIYDKGKRVTFKLRDLTAAFRDITEDMPGIVKDIANSITGNLLLNALQGAAQNPLPADIPENAETETGEET